MIGFLRRMHPLCRAEIVSVLVSTIMYGIILSWMHNFKSAAYASGIAVVVNALFIPTCEALVAAITASAAVAMAIIIALASASIATGALLAVAPVPIETPSPAAIMTVCGLIAALFALIAVFSTTRKAEEMDISKKRAAVSVLIELSVILMTFYILSRSMH